MLKSHPGRTAFFFLLVCNSKNTWNLHSIAAGPSQLQRCWSALSCCSSFLTLNDGKKYIYSKLKCCFCCLISLLEFVLETCSLWQCLKDAVNLPICRSDSCSDYPLAEKFIGLIYIRENKYLVLLNNGNTKDWFLFTDCANKGGAYYGSICSLVC